MLLPVKILYRYEGGEDRLFVVTYNIVKWTPKGYWIKYSPKNKWVAAEGKKRFAYPTEREAMKGFKYRKKRQIYLLSRSLAYAEDQLCEIKKLLKDDSIRNIGKTP